ncbi:component of the counting factor complex [Pelomyxa schiedti]|nr:component of the counting factor complex [Pelomyxa schiedti]
MQWFVLVCLVGVVAVGSAKGAPYSYYCGSTDGQTGPPDNPARNATTKFAVLVTRHGDRVPLHTPCWPGYDDVWNCTLTQLSDPDMTIGGTQPSIPRVYREHYMFGRNALPGNCEKAQLTDIGNTQCKQLGEAMRSYFVDDLEFLPPKHNPGDVFVRYDSDSRTKQSAMAFCDGLYPPGTGGGTTTTVIDMYTMDDSQEDISPNADLCPCLGKYETEAMLTPESLHYDANVVVPLEKQLEEIFGSAVKLNYIECAVYIINAD